MKVACDLSTLPKIKTLFVHVPFFELAGPGLDPKQLLVYGLSFIAALYGLLFIVHVLTTNKNVTKY